jgi:outer membrane protein OmpA-like peptidoglycan-associated protein
MWMHLLIGARAFAQDAADVELPDVNAQLYRHPIDAERTMWTDDTAYAPDGYVQARVMAGYVNEPLVWEWKEGDRMSLVSNALSLDVIGGVTYSRVRFGLDVPVYLVATGDTDSGGGLGDIALDIKGSVLERAEYPVGLAFAARFALPTATTKVPLGNPGFGWELEAIADKEFGQVLVAANLGTRGVPKAELVNVTVDDQLFLRLGAGYAVTETTGVSADLAANFTYASIGNRAGNPAELMVGGWGRVDESIVMRAGLSTGISPGIGSPVARAVLSFAYEPPKVTDTDLDGILDNKDFCVDKPEDADGFDDADGCPDDDNDKDGIVDASDTCKDVPEDNDKYQDNDGCPDLTAPVRILIVDQQTGKPFPGVSAVVSGPNGERLTGDDDFVLDLQAGKYAITAEAAKYLPLKGQFEVVDGPEQMQRFEIVKDVVPGIVKIKVTDPKGKLLDGTWALNDNPAQAVAAGVAESNLAPGEYVMMVRVEGYIPSSLPIVVKEGATASYNVVMQPAKVKITREKLDIKDKIYFETGKAVIKPESFPLLNEVAGILLDRPDILSMRIEGHTDSRGSDSDNLKLSDARAAAVKQYLIDKGVEANRLSSIGFGETKPVDPANNAAAWDKNRRVEFYIEKWAEEE